MVLQTASNDEHEDRQCDDCSGDPDSKKAIAMNGSSRMQRKCDLAFKGLVVGAFVYGTWRYVAVFQYFPLIRTLPAWVFPMLLFVLCVDFFLIRIPLFVGLFARRAWARQLWLIGMLLWLWDPYLSLWLLGPYSPKNNIEHLPGWLAAKGIVIAVCLSGPFRRYMCRTGGRCWFWISLGANVAMVVTLAGLAIHWYNTIPERPYEIVVLPKLSNQQPLPAGWTEADVYDYVIPVPTGSTNDLRTFDDGSEWNKFRESQGKESSRDSVIMKQKAIYRSLPLIYGIESLEKDYRFIYEHDSLPSVLRRSFGQSLSHVGFQSKGDFDLVFGFWSVDGERNFIHIQLEDPTTGGYHEIYIQSSIPLTLDERFCLVSRIRRAETSAVVLNDN